MHTRAAVVTVLLSCDDCTNSLCRLLAGSSFWQVLLILLINTSARALIGTCWDSTHKSCTCLVNHTIFLAGPTHTPHQHQRTYLDRPMLRGEVAHVEALQKSHTLVLPHFVCDLPVCYINAIHLQEQRSDLGSYLFVYLTLAVIYLFIYLGPHLVASLQSGNQGLS